jgi:hypothetical protein
MLAVLLAPRIFLSLSSLCVVDVVRNSLLTIPRDNTACFLCRIRASISLLSGITNNCVMFHGTGTRLGKTNVSSTLLLK